MKNNVNGLQITGAKSSTHDVMTDVGILSIGDDLAAWHREDPLAHYIVRGQSGVREHRTVVM